MKHYTLTAAVLTLAAGAANAGEIERSGDPTQILFEKGKNYIEFSVATVSPTVKGNNISPAVPAGPTGNIARDFQNYAFGYKYQLNDRVALAFVVDEPVGADVSYAPGRTAFFSGSNATVDSFAVSGLVKYQATDRVSVYGGLKLESLKGNISINSPFIPAIFNYNLTVDNDYKLGYIAGAAYEIPDIALRVALTYESKIEHDFRDNNGDKFDVEIPQAITLNAQTGIAKDTLLFGSVRWREWSQFEVTPLDFFNQTMPLTGGSSIASGPSDIITYTLGVGRRFSKNWSGAFVLGYEKDKGDVVGNLSGKDGFISYGLAATYETESWEVTAGVQYFDIGSAQTTGPGANLSSFTGSDAIAFGMKFGFHF